MPEGRVRPVGVGTCHPPSLESGITELLIKTLPLFTTPSTLEPPLATFFVRGTSEDALVVRVLASKQLTSYRHANLSFLNEYKFRISLLTVGSECGLNPICLSNGSSDVS
jgi:hypothetical protein